MSKIDIRLGKELGSFYALVVMNIVVGAVVMGLSMSYGIQNLLAMAKLLPNIESLYSLPVAAIAIAVFGVAISWLISSTEIFGETQEIREEFEKKDGTGETNTTSIIVKTMAFYRERKATIDRMALVSRLAGILLLGMGAYNLVSLALFGVQGEIVLTVISSTMNFAMGAVALYIPHLFSNFSRSWDSRLAQGQKAEEELRHVLEGKAF